MSVSRRVQRVEKELRQAVAMYLSQHQSGAKEGLLCVSNVKVSPDLRSAKVYVSQVGALRVDLEVLEGLKRYIPEIQTYVHSRLRTKYCPKIVFYNDDSVEFSARMDQVFSTIERPI